MLPECLCQRRDQLFRQQTIPRGFLESGPHPGIISIAPITGSLAPSRKVASAVAERPDRSARRAAPRRFLRADAVGAAIPKRSHGTKPPRRPASRAPARSDASRPENRTTCTEPPDFGSPSVPSTIESSADAAARANSPRQTSGGISQAIQMTPRQPGHLPHGLSRRRACTGAEMLHSPASLGQPGQHRQASHRGFRILGRGRQSQARKLVHDRSEARPVDVLVRFLHPSANRPIDPLFPILLDAIGRQPARCNSSRPRVAV